jgi:adenylate cyclase class 2
LRWAVLFFLGTLIFMEKKENREIEAKFLEIQVLEFKKKLTEVGATDKGEKLLQETIFYDTDLSWLKEHMFVRIRADGDTITVTYKHSKEKSVDGTEEIEIQVDDANQAHLLLERFGLVAYRKQQKKRHSFLLDNVKVDIDTWPKIPTYVELEGDSEADLKKVAAKLGLDWNNAVFESARHVIEERYHIPVGTYHYFTFSRVE